MSLIFRNSKKPSRLNWPLEAQKFKMLCRRLLFFCLNRILYWSSFSCLFLCSKQFFPSKFCFSWPKAFFPPFFSTYPGYLPRVNFTSTLLTDVLPLLFALSTWICGTWPGQGMLQYMVLWMNAFFSIVRAIIDLLRNFVGGGREDMKPQKLGQIKLVTVIR